MTKSIHDEPQSEFEVDPYDIYNEDWTCDHGKKFKDDCFECDEQWLPASGYTEWPGELDYEVVEGEPEPDQCDHDKRLDNKTFGVCEACDKECHNMANSQSMWRIIDGRKHSNIAGKWKPIGSGTTWSKSCEHYMDEFHLDNNMSIYASAERDAPFNEKRPDEEKPDLAVYLYSGWFSTTYNKRGNIDIPWQNKTTEPEWPMAWLEWPDFGVPRFEDAIIATEWVLSQLQHSKQVETGCMGGHGRTGTFLALLLCLQGVKPGTAMHRVQETYCKDAIESNSQRDFIVKAYEHWHGKGWKQSKTERNLVNSFAPAKGTATNTPPKPAKPANPNAQYDPKPADSFPPDAICLHGVKMKDFCSGCAELFD